MPHVQLDQFPPAEIAGQLRELALGIPGVRARQSRMAFPSSVALCLTDESAQGPPEAFIDNHEFCLLHDLPEASIHVTLPKTIRERVLATAWGEPHPAVRTGIAPETLFLLYAPRNAQELRVVFDLIAESSRFAKGSRGFCPHDCRREGAMS
ncbi:MAG TPA: hypothetical protein VMU19_01595, partial [Bryobacteraceae bacterium]|nr:hypothetical protein [Bryobacteraceae bacterium]